MLEHGQSEIPDAARQVALDEDVPARQVAVGHRELGLVVGAVGVEVSQSVAHGRRHLQHNFRGHRTLAKIVLQRAELVIPSGQPELGPTLATGHGTGKARQYVFVRLKNPIVEQRLSEPRTPIAPIKLFQSNLHPFTAAVVESAEFAHPYLVVELHNVFDVAHYCVGQIGAAATFR